MDINSYVMPVFRRAGDERSFAGTAFCIDGYLATAGHVLTNPVTYYVRNGADWHPLEHLMWRPRQLPSSDQHGYDVALYPVPGLRSPLSLAERDAEPDDELDVVCWQWKPDGLQQVVTRGLVLKEPDEEEYLRIATVDRITHGSSGCPVFRDCKVYGILTMGRDAVDTAGMTPLKSQIERNTCWAFKTSYVRRFMP
ncbi:MAG: trypsin-like peptidase domain-containing protein [Muribaculaceae bacterium]|nr:trypsin-like peptidase domain-containing protein [Muribaculaceae bacterium]